MAFQSSCLHLLTTRRPGPWASGRQALALAWLVGLSLLGAGIAMAQPVEPEILRGSAAPPPPMIEPAAGPSERRMIAGERLWIVDEKARRVTGCRLVNTIRVGVQAIDCSTRRLPKGAGGRY